MAEPCPITGKKHKYEWVRDATNTKIVSNSKGTRVTQSRRGVYKCECGKVREGTPRSGL